MDPGPVSGAPRRSSVAPGVLRLDDGRLELTLGTGDGPALAKLAWEGGEVMCAGPKANLWRAATDNDGMKMFLGTGASDLAMGGKALGRWLDWGLDQLTIESSRPRVSGRGNNLIVTADSRIRGHLPAVMARHRQVIRLGPGPHLIFEETMIIPAAWDDLPRVGVEMAVPAGFERLERLCLGPHENYVDRAAGAVLGRWLSTVDEQSVPYVMPQEHANRTGTRWLSLEQTEGDTRLGLGIATLGDPVDSTVRHHSTEALWRARDWSELEPSPQTHVYLDVGQRGLGTASCGPDTLEAYRLGAGTYRFSWRLSPYILSPPNTRVERKAQTLECFVQGGTS